MSGTKHANMLAATRESDFPKWYLEVIKQADLAEQSVSRGCMVIKPWGYAMWERIQSDLDRRFKETGHVNAYFPVLIPKSLIEKEAEHVEGFAKEMAVVTHHRLVASDEGLIPDGPLEEPYVIRPTSETIIGESYSRWVNSYRDLPILINQWANVVRWEMRTRLFLRTTEFLWQEGHTAHATQDEAIAETNQMLEIYVDFAQSMLAMPVVAGEKTTDERFPGAVNTFTIEAMMQDGKALQAGTSHYLGENFARSSNIMFDDRDGEKKYAHTTSWGVSTRLIGGVVMTHADDIGLRLPPSLSPEQVIVVPMDVENAELEIACNDFAEALRAQLWRGSSIRVKVDNRDIDAPTRRWQWTRRGAPLVIEIGERDLSSGLSMCSKRWTAAQPDRALVEQELIVSSVVEMLEECQNAMYDQAKDFLDSRTASDLDTIGDVVELFANEHEGFAVIPWDGVSPLPADLSDLGVTARCIPLSRITSTHACAISGNDAVCDLVLAKSY